MKREKGMLDKRAEYVKEFVNKRKKLSRSVDFLSKTLFVSKQTIYKDLKK